MWIMRQLSIKAKLVGLVTVCIVGLVGMTLVAYNTLTLVKVHGPLYQQIVQGKDLIADVLPPPAYVIESYLLVLQMGETTDPQEVARLVERSKSLRTEVTN